MLGRDMVLLRGAVGLRNFYDTARVKRSGAMPLPIQGSLFGEGLVHGLDDEEHLHRKATFVRVCYGDTEVERIKPMAEAEIREAMNRWRKATESVYDTTMIAYGRAAMRWAGIEVRDAELDVQARRLGDIVEGFAHLSTPRRFAAPTPSSRCCPLGLVPTSRCRASRFGREKDC